MKTKVSHGYVVIRPDGRRVDDAFHPTEQSAATVAAFLNGARVARAKRMRTYVQRHGMLHPIRSEIIVEGGASA